MSQILLTAFSNWRAESDCAWWFPLDSKTHLRSRVPAPQWAVICTPVDLSGGIEMLFSLLFIIDRDITLVLLLNPLGKRRHGNQKITSSLDPGQCKGVPVKAQWSGADFQCNRCQEFGERFLDTLVLHASGQGWPALCSPREALSSGDSDPSFHHP